MSTFTGHRYDEVRHADADVAFRAATRKLSKTVLRAMDAETPAERREWSRSVRRAQRNQAEARRALIATTPLPGLVAA